MYNEKNLIEKQLYAQIFLKKHQGKEGYEYEINHPIIIKDNKICYPNGKELIEKDKEELYKQIIEIEQKH